jgi:hypothetical protein
MNGVPVLGTAIGAVGERIRRTGGGWLVDVDAPPKQVLEQLHSIKAHPEEYQEKRQIVAQMQHKSVAQMGLEYRSLYEQLLASDVGEACEQKAPEIDYDFIFQGLALGNPSIGGRDGAARMNRLKNENAALKAYIEVIKGTASYRLARKLADGNLPFKEPLKRLVKKLRSR